MEPNNTPAPPASSNLTAQVEELAEEVRGETERREQVQAQRRTTSTRHSRDWWATAALAIALPVLIALVVATARGESVFDWFTPAPGPAQARAQAEDTMKFVVTEIDGFREDYGELPETLAQVAAPTNGKWEYTRDAGNQYRLTFTLHGQVIAFDSKARGGASQ